jgi:hypothetical protein
LRTAEELNHRLGFDVIQWDHTVVIHVRPGSYGSLFLTYALVASGIEFDIVGEGYANLAAGKVSAFSPVSHTGTTPVGTHVTVTGVADLTPYVGKVMLNATTGSVAVIAKANPHGLGNNVARVSVPIDIYTSGGTWSVNDNWIIPVLPTFVHLNIVNAGAYLYANGGSYTTIQLLSITGGLGLYGGSGGTYTWGCSCTCDMYGGDAITNGNPFYCGSYVRPMHELLPAGCSVLNSLLVGSVAAANSLSYVGIGAHSPSYISNSIVQGVRLRCESGSIVFMDSQFFDAPDVALELEDGASVTVDGSISGRDNLIGVRLRANTQLVKVTPTGILNVLGTTAVQAQSSSTTYSSLTWAAATLYSDGALSGTLTIGGTAPGYVNVAVPFVDWTRQRLMLTERDDAGGVPTASVSAPTANRTTTGFRALSTSTADVSTYDWYITPLGQGVYVSQRP